MRPLIEIFVIALVIYVGWNQPFKQHAAAVFPNLAEPKPAANPIPGSAVPTGTYTAPVRPPVGSNAWMWQENSKERPRPADARVNHR